MRYFGGKAKIAKELSGVLNNYLIGNDKPFIDAFCGSCNVISKIDSNRIRIANDKHKELIAMWQWVKEMGVDRLPTDVSKELYYYIKTSTTSPDWLKGLLVLVAHLVVSGGVGMPHLITKKETMLRMQLTQ